MAKLIRIYAAEGLYQIALQYFVPMEQLDVVFRPLTNTDFAILNKWIVQLGWPTGRSDPEVEADPSGRLKYAVNVGAEDAKCKYRINCVGVDSLLDS